MVKDDAGVVSKAASPSCSRQASACRSMTPRCAMRRRRSPPWRSRAARWHRLVARLGGQGDETSGGAGGDRAELRAHPPSTWSAWASCRSRRRGNELEDTGPEGRRDRHHPRARRDLEAAPDAIRRIVGRRREEELPLTCSIVRGRAQIFPERRDFGLRAAAARRSGVPATRRRPGEHFQDRGKTVPAIPVLDLRDLNGKSPSRRQFPPRRPLCGDLLGKLLGLFYVARSKPAPSRVSRNLSFTAPRLFLARRLPSQFWRPFYSAPHRPDVSAADIDAKVGGAVVFVEIRSNPLL